MKMTVFWVIASCFLVEVIALMMEAASTSETSVNFYQTTRRNNPEDSHLQEIPCFFSTPARPCSHDPPAGKYPEPDECNQHTIITYFLKTHVNINSTSYV
jgi:hypothetical protein